MEYKVGMDAWAIDLGTTNTGLAYWDSSAQAAHLLALPAICRRPERDDPLEAPRMIPSAVQCLPANGMLAKLGRSPFFMKRFFWGQQGLIGRAALEGNSGGVHQPSFAPSFKQFLSRSPHQTLATLRGRNISAREIARTFLRELLHEVKTTVGTRIRELVITVPVESYDQYRAELAQIGRSLGLKKIRFIDEPVAAAIGYGLGLKGSRTVLVVDFGGGTLDLAVVELTPRTTEDGACRVVAKAGRPIGGQVIDQWLLEDFAAILGMRVDPKAQGERKLWQTIMMDEARRVKEAVHFNDTATFSVAPPPTLRQMTSELGPDARYFDTDRNSVKALLQARGLYDILKDCTDEVRSQLVKQGTSEESIEDILMVGGSTLLPGVYPFFEERFGRGRVRAWQPFEAVAYGAAAFAAGSYGQSDFLVHDYAVVTYRPGTNEKEYIPIVEHGTRFPTRPDHWKKSLVPTCALGEPETIFKLVVCEMSGFGRERQFVWDAEGQLHKVKTGEAQAPLIVPLNESNPALGALDPPHLPGDRQARLEVAFGVNEDRWLVATVKDLKTDKLLMNQDPVVQLL